MSEMGCRFGTIDVFMSVRAYNTDGVGPRYFQRGKPAILVRTQHCVLRIFRERGHQACRTVTDAQLASGLHRCARTRASW